MTKKKIRSVVRRWSVRGGLVAGLFTCMLAYQNCSGDFSSNSGVLSASHFSSIVPTGSGNTTATSPASGTSAAPTGQLAVAQPMAQAGNLGTTIQFPVTVSSSGGYSGTVALSIAEPELAEVDSGKGITFSVSPASVTVSDSQSATAMVTVKITTMAPSFNASLFHVVATDSETPAVTSSAAVPLQVNAVYDVTITSALTKPETWSVSIGADISFIPHAEGLVVNFHNMAPSGTLVVHSTGGPISHESLTGMQPGGVYTQKVASSTTTATSQVWDHNNEGSAQSRNLMFNVPVPKPVATPTPTPGPTPTGATFANINTTIIQTSCVGCHSGATPAGNTNLSTYADVLLVVTAGNSMTSVLYNEVASGAMPIGGTALTAAQLLDIADWINAGAPNN